MLLACLDFQSTFYGGTFQYDGFARIAQELGHQVESTSHDGTSEGFKKALDKAGRLIEEASAFFLPNRNIFGCEDYSSRIRRRVEGGASLLVTPWINDYELDNWNCLLAPYDLTVSTLRICTRIGTSLFGVDGDITISRNANSYRHPGLFRGVDQVVLTQPVAIWYGGQSLPALMMTDAELPFDVITDFLPIPESPIDPETQFPPEWNARELSCMAVWYGENGGAVLASIGPALYDPSIEQNARLAANIIAFLAENAKQPLSPEEHCHRIEINLVDFVLEVVKSTGDNWWTERIPLTVRQKCAERHEEEKCRWPKEAYLDLIDLKTIINKEWTLFESHLRAVGCEGGKEKSLAWLDRLNEIRRMVGHPLKKHVAGYNFSSEEKTLLARCDDMVLHLFRRVRPRSYSRH